MRHYLALMRMQPCSHLIAMAMSMLTDRVWQGSARYHYDGQKIPSNMHSTFRWNIPRSSLSILARPNVPEVYRMGLMLAL